MKRYIWKIKERNSQIEELAKKYAIPPLLIQLLLNRDIEEGEFDSFLKPDLSCLHSPYLLPDIEKAAKRIKRAIEKKEKVLVFGDYDVDGVTSLAIFHEFAKKYSNLFTFYIPHRTKEGYGLNKEAILRAKEEGISLVIAFDCGTNANEEVSLAASLEIDVIVVDHHILRENLNGAFAFINPKRGDSNYPFSELSTAAIAFKLLQVLKGSDCWEVLDLVVLSLICDVVVLKGENRTLVIEGLKYIKESQRPAVKALCKISSIKQKNIDIFHIGYILGPRINAAGRVAHAEESLELFITQDQKKCEKLANKLSEHNKLRRAIESQILKEAEIRVKEDLDGNSAIVVTGDSWHQGVLGIVASRLADKYCRPSFVISFEHNTGKGSARSIQNVHLMEVLEKCSDSLIAYGGHKKAAGVHIDKDELDNFKERINSLLEESITAGDFIPMLDIEAQLSFSQIDLALANSLENFKPYGEGNPKPLFSSCGIFKKTAPRKVKSYYSLWLTDGVITFEGVVYDKDLLEVLDFAETFDIVFSLQTNYYHNIPKLIIKTCRLAFDN